jgi:hypothetical protein
VAVIDVRLEPNVLPEDVGRIDSMGAVILVVASEQDVWQADVFLFLLGCDVCAVEFDYMLMSDYLGFRCIGSIIQVNSTYET